MRRPITETERAAAQMEIEIRKRAVRFGLLTAFEATVRDETNEHGEVVIECIVGFVPALDRVTTRPATVSNEC